MRTRTVLFAVLALFGASLASHAGVVYDVSLDTTALIGPSSYLGPFYVAFEFADGSGTLDGNNAVILSDFQFGGGGPVGSPITYIGVGESGSLDSGTVTMVDDDPVGFFAQGFWPGTTLSFLLQSTTNVDPCCTYDEFTFGIMDPSFSYYIPTTAGDGTDLMSLTLDDPVNPTVATYSSDLTQTYIALGPPLVSETPEPATWLPVALILGGGCLRRRWWARP
jgi:hypothetical protein